MSDKKINLDEKFYIAGASGMVGSAIYRALRMKGYGEKKNNGKILTPNRKELDLSKSADVGNWFKINKPSIVILAAAKVGGILANSNQPADFLLENLKIQTNIINSSFENNVKRFLFLGSSCIYPKFAKQPIKEEELLKGELEKTNESYAIAKICGIKLCEALRLQYGFDAISLMPTNLYGPGDNYNIQNSHVMAALIRKFYYAKKYKLAEVTCFGDGSALREFLHVDDLGAAAIFAMENWDPNDRCSPKYKESLPLTFLNVGTGYDISIKDLTKKISQFIGYEGKTKWDISKPNGTPKKQLDISRILKIGWAPQIKLEDGIKSTIEDFEKNLHLYIRN